jgi:transcriptional regulator with XRE-family HTH domain
VNLRERVETAAKRAGFDSQQALAEACGVKQPSIHALISGKYPMKELLRTVAEKTNVSADWLRDGNAHDAPPWARDPLLLAIDDAQAAVQRLVVVTQERDAALARNKVLEAALAEANEALRRMALQFPDGARRAADGHTAYRIGQAKRKKLRP